MSASVVLPLVGLAALALVPVLYKKLRGTPPDKGQGA
jgi:hypothetical protein